MLKVVVYKKVIFFSRGPVAIPDTYTAPKKIPEAGMEYHVIEITLNGTVYHGLHRAVKTGDGKVKVWELTFTRAGDGVLVNHEGEYAYYDGERTVKTDSPENLEKALKTVKKKCILESKDGITAINHKVISAFDWDVENGTLVLKIEELKIPLLPVHGNKVKVRDVWYHRYSNLTVKLETKKGEVDVIFPRGEVWVYWGISKFVHFAGGTTDPKFLLFWEALMKSGDPDEASTILEVME